MGTIHVLRVRVNSEDESVARGQVAIGRVDLQFCSSGEDGDSDPGRRVIKSDRSRQRGRVRGVENCNGAGTSIRAARCYWGMV
jgi:hypothetical protein